MLHDPAKIVKNGSGGPIGKPFASAEVSAGLIGTPFASAEVSAGPTGKPFASLEPSVAANAQPATLFIVLPDWNARMFSAAMAMSRVRASRVAQAMCGVR